MTENKPKVTKTEFWTEEPPPVVEMPEVPAAPASMPNPIAIAGVGNTLVVSQELPALDDPSVLLRQLTAQLSSIGGPMTGEQMAQEAERQRHNAHVGAERMIDLEERRRRREAQGKPRNKGDR